MSMSTDESPTLPLPGLLIVDDEEGPRQSVRILFKKDFEVQVASEGRTALEMAQERAPAVAILDIMMPGMNGIEVLEGLKAIDPSIQIIMLTAYETLDTARQALRLGACDYLNKPFDMTAMRESVARALEKHHVARGITDTHHKLELLQQQLMEQRMKEETMRGKEEIYLSVLHDLNNPLTVISSFIQMIHRSLLTTNSLEGDQLQAMRSQVSKLTGQVGFCVDVARRYTNLLHPNEDDVASVSVAQVMRDTAALLGKPAAGAGHVLEVEPFEKLWNAAMHGTDLLQVLLNLVSNAMQCSEAPHTIVMRAKLHPNGIQTAECENNASERWIASQEFEALAPVVAIEVVDNGPGIPASAMPKLFDTRYTTKAVGKGSGLGLSIIRRLVLSARGAVRLRTKPGSGSVITVYLPLAPEEAAGGG